MKFSIFKAEKNSLYITWASFRYAIKIHDNFPSKNKFFFFLFFFFKNLSYKSCRLRQVNVEALHIGLTF